MIKTTLKGKHNSKKSELKNARRKLLPEKKNLVSNTFKYNFMVIHIVRYERVQSQLLCC